VADVRFLPAAEADAQAALAWYRGRSARAAAAFEAALADAVQRVADSPDAYALIDDRHRRCLLKRYPYSLVYRGVPDGVLVVAVAHSSRSPSFWQDRA
jgi:plasmid stabilization system protein ParE